MRAQRQGGAAQNVQVQVDRGTPREAWRGRVGTTALVRKLQRDSNGIFPPTLKVLAEGARALETRPLFLCLTLASTGPKVLQVTLKLPAL